MRTPQIKASAGPLVQETLDVDGALRGTESPLSARQSDVRDRATRIFNSASWEEFETGTESYLARSLQALVRQHSTAAIDAIRELVLVSPVDGEAGWETLRWLGCLKHPPSRAARLWLLEQALESPSAKVRDGAVLGLAAIDDPHAIPAFRKAIAAERIPELREDLIQVLGQLESTARCPSP